MKIIYIYIVLLFFIYVIISCKSIDVYDYYFVNNSRSSLELKFNKNTHITSINWEFLYCDFSDENCSANYSNMTKTLHVDETKHESYIKVPKQSIIYVNAGVKYEIHINAKFDYMVMLDNKPDTVFFYKKRNFNRVKGYRDALIYEYTEK